MSRIFLDVETTGLSPGDGHRIIEIAAIAYAGHAAGGGERGKFHRLLDPERDVPSEAVEIHGISYSKLDGKEKFADISQELAAYLKDCELIAHNAPFDVAFLDMEFRRVGMPPVSKVVAKVTDTLEIAARLYPGGRNSLDAIATRAGIDVKARRPKHNALIDAEILAEVYMYLTGGQTALELQSDAVKFSSALPKASDIKIHLIEEDTEDVRQHEEYLARMLDECSVRPMAMDER